MKPVVHYKPTKNDYVSEGYSALLHNVIDHPITSRVSNRAGQPVTTSQVVKIYVYKAGFETLNTVYVPTGELDEVEARIHSD